MKMYNEGEKWSEEVEYDNDAGLLRRGDFQGEGTHIAVSRNPFDPEDDEHNNTASAVFFHRNRGFYLGTEQAAVFYCHNIQADWGEGYNPPHLQCISGMAEHIKDPFIIFNPHTSINGTVMNNFMVFWSQHERMSDLDHDISYNFRYTDEDDLTGWQYIQRATADDSNNNQYRSEFFPSVAINNSYLSSDDPTPTDYTGDIYVVSYDYCGAEGQDLLYSEYDASEEGWKRVQPVTGTDDAGTWHTDECWNSSVAYAYYEDEDPEHYVYLASNYLPDSTPIPETPVLKFTYKNPDAPNPAWERPGSIYEIYPEIASPPRIIIDAYGDIYIAYVRENNMIYLARCIYPQGSTDPQRWDHLALVQTDKVHRYLWAEIDPTDNDSFHIVFTELRGDGGTDIFWMKWTDDGDSDWEKYDWSDHTFL
jgi:hypothetical protein